MDRALPSGGRGWRFDSSRGRVNGDKGGLLIMAVIAAIMVGFGVTFIQPIAGLVGQNENAPIAVMLIVGAAVIVGPLIAAHARDWWRARPRSRRH